MRYLPIITIALWLSTVFGYVFIPQFILLPSVKFPLIILLNILIPVCFWILQKNEKNFYAGIFIAIFLFNIGFPAYGAWQNNQRLVALEEYVPMGIKSEMAKLIVKGDSVDERRMAALILFENFGVQLPFKLEGDEYQLFKPTKTNRDNYVSNHDKYYRARLALTNLKLQNNSIYGLIVLQALLFFILLIFQVFYDKTKR